MSKTTCDKMEMIHLISSKMELKELEKFWKKYWNENWCFWFCICSGHIDS